MPPPRAPRTVAFIMGTLAIGGAEGQVIELLKALPDHGYRPVVVLLEEVGGHLDKVRAMGIPLHLIHAVMTYRKYDPRFTWHFAGTIRRTAAAIRSEKADIVHAYLYWASIFGTFGGVLARAPHIITSRRNTGFFKDGRTGYQAIENLTNRFVSAATANSIRVHEDMMRREKIDLAKTCVIYNGVDFPRFAQAAARNLRAEFPAVADADPLVGVVANLKGHKAHGDLIEAMAIARRDSPSLKCLCFGFDKEGHLQGYLERVRALGLEQHLLFVDGVADAAPVYRALDALCLSSHDEGFANVLLEGMSAGLPIVATDVGGNAEAVVDGETGLIVPPRQPARLAEALVTIARDPARRRAMGEAGQRRARECFSIESMVRDTVALYDALLESGKLPPVGPGRVLEGQRTKDKGQMGAGG